MPIVDPNKVCVICQDVMLPDDPDIITLNCAHQLHDECYKTVLEQSGSLPSELPCPVCRMTADQLLSQEHTVHRPDRSMPLGSPIMSLAMSIHDTESSDEPDDLEAPAEDEWPADENEELAVEAGAHADEPESLDVELGTTAVEPAAPAVEVDAPAVEPQVLATRGQRRRNTAAAKAAARAAAAMASQPTLMQIFGRQPSVPDVTAPVATAPAVLGSQDDPDDNLSVREVHARDADDLSLIDSQGDIRHAGTAGGTAKGSSGKGERQAEPSAAAAPSGKRKRDADNAKGAGKRARTDAATTADATADADAPGKGCKRGNADAIDQRMGKRARKGSATAAAAATSDADVPQSQTPTGQPVQPEPQMQAAQSTPADASQPEPQPLACLPCMPKSTYFCSWCGCECTPAQGRLVNKSAQRFKCKKCACTMVKAHNALGSWPNAQFQALSAEAQQTFYKEAHDITSSRDLVKSVSQHLETYTIQEAQWAMGGKFLPPDVWERKGFDKQRIIDTTGPEDIIETVQAGLCYRVRLLSKSEVGRSGTRRSMLLGLEPASQHPGLAIENIAAASAAAAAAAAAPPNPAPAADPPAPPSAESRESFLARQKQEKESRKAIDKATNEKKTACNQLCKKMAGPLKSLGDALNHARSNELSPVLLASAKELLKTAATKNDQATACAANPAANTFEPAAEKEAVWGLA